jgi:hypothetical protein
VTGLYLACGIAGWTLLGLGAWVAFDRSRTRIAPMPAPVDSSAGPVGFDVRTCESEQCMDRTLHLVMPCGAALCLGCDYENPAPLEPDPR